MSYLDDIGDGIRARVPSDVLPTGDLDSLFRLYALLALAKGDAVTAADVHNAWTAWMQGQGAVEHKALLPFDQLDETTQAKDLPFATAIRSVAQGLSG